MLSIMDVVRKQPRGELLHVGIVTYRMCVGCAHLQLLFKQKCVSAVQRLFPLCCGGAVLRQLGRGGKMSQAWLPLAASPKCARSLRNRRGGGGLSSRDSQIVNRAWNRGHFLAENGLSVGLGFSWFVGSAVALSAFCIVCLFSLGSSASSPIGSTSSAPSSAGTSKLSRASRSLISEASQSVCSASVLSTIGIRWCPTALISALGRVVRNVQPRTRFTNRATFTSG